METANLIIFLVFGFLAFQCLQTEAEVIELYPPDHPDCKEETIHVLPKWGDPNDYSKDRKITKTLKGNGCVPYIKCWHSEQAPSCQECYVSISDEAQQSEVIIDDALDNGPWTYSKAKKTQLEITAGICASDKNPHGFNCYFICRK